MSAGNLNLCGPSQCLDGPGPGTRTMTLPELGVAVGVLKSLAASGDACRVLVEGVDAEIELPAGLYSELSRLLGKCVVVARVCGEYRVAELKGRQHGHENRVPVRGWGSR